MDEELVNSMMIALLLLEAKDWPPTSGVYRIRGVYTRSPYFGFMTANTNGMT
jgi:hypothetical protein